MNFIQNQQTTQEDFIQGTQNLSCIKGEVTVSIW
jgi:hypothetical protein